MSDTATSQQPLYPKGGFRHRLRNAMSTFAAMRLDGLRIKPALRPVAGLALLSLCTLPVAPAHALSCLPHDVARTYEQAAKSDKTYIVVHGTLTFDESRLPKTDWQNQQKTPPNTLIPAQLKGKALTRNGFVARFNRPITFNVQCLGPWCASAESGTAYLAFLRRTGTPSGSGETGQSASGGSYQLDINACGGMGFAAPSGQALETVVECFRGGPCKPQDQRP